MLCDETDFCRRYIVGISILPVLIDRLALLYPFGVVYIVFFFVTSFYYVLCEYKEIRSVLACSIARSSIFSDNKSSSDILNKHCNISPIFRIEGLVHIKISEIFQIHSTTSTTVLTYHSRLISHTTFATRSSSLKEFLIPRERFAIEPLLKCKTLRDISYIQNRLSVLQFCFGRVVESLKCRSI